MDGFSPSLLFLLAGGGGGGPQLNTIVTAVVAGVGLTLIARRFDLPSIVLLLAGGVALGPMVWGERAPIQPDALGDGLGVLVSLCVGLILFEGGLTLDRKGYMQAPSVIRRLLTLGVGVTWLGTTACLHWICDISWASATTTAALVIVTGPTVVGPLLKKIGVDERLASILRWEAVLIDPIGVFIAVLCFEWLIEGGGQGAFLNLVVRAVAGLAIGAVGGLAISAGLRSRRLVPEDLLNVFALAGAVLTFGAAESVLSETGLLSVTVAGFIVGLTHSGAVQQVHKFKEELTSLLIALVFMLLAARLGIEQVKSFGLNGALAVLGVIVIVRPLNIFLCSLGGELSTKDRLFLSWIAPRGVVAASMASLIAIHLERGGQADNARFVETFTWSVIVGTIVLQGSTAGLVVRALGLEKKKPTGWGIVGAHALSRAIARAFQEDGRHVVLIDNNPQHVSDANEEGLKALTADARDPALLDDPELSAVGNLLVLTDNADLNLRICRVWAPHVGKEQLYRWAEHDAPDHDHHVGVPLLWGEEPSAIARDVERGVQNLVQLPKSDGEQGTTLLAVGRVSEGAHATSRRLALLPRGAVILKGFDPARVISCERPATDEIYAAAIETFDEGLQAEPPRAAPAVVEQGVAVLHSHSTNISHPQLAVVKLRDRGVQLAPEPEPPVRVLFVLISPRGNAKAHLTALGELARLLADDAHRESFVQAADTEALSTAVLAAIVGLEG